MADIEREPSEQRPEEEPKTEIAPEMLTPDQRAGLTLLEEICASTKQEVRPVVRSVQDPYVHIELVGDDVRATWGRMGQALDALQFLANLILSRRVGSDVRMMLDADNYRARRADALRIRALDLAGEVKARNEEAELEPLPAHERRIIHSALADDPDVRTYSEGDEPGRHVVISPR
jgi:spoIIIJ-associated protein